MLEKRRDLMRQGLSLSNLLITVVRKPDGEGHAVLTVRTDKGDFVLDNLTDSVRQWDQTGYRFLKRQATNHTGRWVTIREGQSEPLVGSVQVAAALLRRAWSSLAPGVSGNPFVSDSDKTVALVPTPPAPCARR